MQAFEANPGLIDIFWFANDFGTQKGLMIHPRVWRKLFKPKIKQLADLGHKHKLKVAMHSCGDIHDIIPDLIEIGVEILNPIQVSAANMDPVVLKREYGKDLIFFGAIDYNQLLNYGTEEEVRAERPSHGRRAGRRWQVHRGPIARSDDGRGAAPQHLGVVRRSCALFGGRGSRSGVRVGASIFRPIGVAWALGIRRRSRWSGLPGRMAAA